MSVSSATIRSRMRHISSANNWWERSPNSGNSTNFCNVNSDGTANNNNASNSNLLAPCGYLRKIREVVRAKPQSASENDDSKRMQGATSWAHSPNKRRRSRGGLRSRDSRALGAAPC